MVARPDARGTGSAVAAPAYSLGDRMQRCKCPKALVTHAAVANPTRLKDGNAGPREPRTVIAAVSLIPGEIVVPDMAIYDARRAEVSTRCDSALIHPNPAVMDTR